MAQPIAVAPIPGVKDFLTLLAFIQDSKAAGEYIAKLELTRQEINSLIGVYGKASEIDGLNAKAGSALNDAQATLEAAKGQADEIIAKANAEAEKVRSDAAAAASQVTQERKDFDTYRAGQLVTINAEVTRLEKLGAEVGAREAAANAALSSANALKQQLSDRLLKIRAATAE